MRLSTRNEKQSMSNFEWQTEDDYDWDTPQEETTALPSNRWLVPFIFLCLLLGLVGFSVYQRLNQNVLSATERIEEQLLAAHKTIFTAAQQNDLELFNRLLSGRDRSWATGQQQMLGEGQLLNRSAFGLTMVEEIPTVSDIRLSPDLKSAVITATTPYHIKTSSGVTNTVELNLVSVLRYGSSDQWLYAPPLTDFWGEISYLPILTEVRKPILSAEFPQRDAKIVRRLVNDLTETYKQLCHLNKPDAYRSSAENCLLDNYEIIFSTAPTSLVSTPSVPHEQSQPFIVATPTLVGLPQGEAGYNALLTGYARQLFPPIIAELTGYDCCDKRLYFDALVTWQLAAVGLLPDPMSLLERDTIIASLPDVNNANWIWEEASDATAQLVIAHLFTEYPSLTGVEMITSLNQSKLFPVWLDKILNQTNSPTHPKPPGSLTAYKMHLYQFAAQMTAADSPIPLPDETLMLSCQVGADSVLMSYDPMTQALVEQHRFPDVSNLLAFQMPKRDAVWLETRGEMPNQSSQAYLYRAGDTNVSILLPLNNRLAPAQIDIDCCDSADGQYVIKVMENNNYSSVNWSADGNWLLLMGDGVGRLVAPQHDYVHLLAPPLYCSSAVWFSPTP